MAELYSAVFGHNKMLVFVAYSVAMDNCLLKLKKIGE